MNIFIYSLVIFVLCYLILKALASMNTKKLSKIVMAKLIEAMAAFGRAHNICVDDPPTQDFQQHPPQRDTFPFQWVDRSVLHRPPDRTPYLGHLGYP